VVDNSINDDHLNVSFVSVIFDLECYYLTKYHATLNKVNQ